MTNMFGFSKNQAFPYLFPVISNYIKRQVILIIVNIVHVNQYNPYREIVDLFTAYTISTQTRAGIKMWKQR